MPVTGGLAVTQKRSRWEQASGSAQAGTCPTRQDLGPGGHSPELGC